MTPPLLTRRVALGLAAFGASPAANLLGAPAIPAPAGHAPERMVLTMPGNPATTQSMTWETAAALTSPQGQVAKISAHPNFEASATTVQGKVNATDAGQPGSYLVTFTALEPGTRYLCRVGDGKAWSEWTAFRTADAGPAPFRFL